MGHLTLKSAELLKEYVYQPRPVGAVQLTEANAHDVALMVGGKLYPATKQDPSVRVYFNCCNGRVMAQWGDWIIREGREFRKLTNMEFIEMYREKK